MIVSEVSFECNKAINYNHKYDVCILSCTSNQMTCAFMFLYQPDKALNAQQNFCDETRSSALWNIFLRQTVKNILITNYIWLQPLKIFLITNFENISDSDYKLEKYFWFQHKKYLQRPPSPGCSRPPSPRSGGVKRNPSPSQLDPEQAEILRSRLGRARKVKLYLLQQSGSNSFLVAGDQPGQKYKVNIGPQVRTVKIFCIWLI